jgi:hypothetical protein
VNTFLVILRFSAHSLRPMVITHGYILHYYDRKFKLIYIAFKLFAMYSI